MKQPEMYLSPEKLKGLFDYIKSQNERDFVLFFTLYMCGRRINEATKLTVRNVDWDKKRILWHILKRHKIKRDAEGNKVLKPNGKPVYIPDDVTVLIKAREPILEALKRLRDATHLDIDTKFFPISRQRVHILFKKYCFDYGIKTFGKRIIAGKEREILPRPHMLRRLFAIHFIEANPGTTTQQIEHLQRLLQHKNPTTCFEYLQFDDDDMNQYLDKMPNVWGSFTPAQVPKPVDTQPADHKENQAAQESALKENLPAQAVEDHSADNPEECADNKEKAL
jgi:integrase